MRFRYIFIPKLVAQLLRGNYLTRYDYNANEQPMRVTYLYKICLAICYCIQRELRHYYQHRSRWYMIASCIPSYANIQSVISYLYNTDITITPSGAQGVGSYWYSEDEPKRYVYAEDDPQVFVGTAGTFSEVAIINVSQSLIDNTELYSEFIADLNLLFPFFLSYTIKPV